MDPVSELKIIARIRSDFPSKIRHPTPERAGGGAKG